MALGARSGQLVGGMVLESAWPVALGLAIGTAGAFAVTGVIESFLFETEPTDPMTFGLALVLLAATALLAAWIPASRAARVDPVEALRAE